MEENKLNLIADNLHYPIEVSAIEKRIISTQIFNRLHNILQNSTVYLTYPSNRTTRFTHSLGCMYISGQIFQNGINNATKEDRKLFFEAIEKEVSSIIKRKDFGEKVGQFITNKKDMALAIMKMPEIISDPLYTASMPGNLSRYLLSPEEFRSYKYEKIFKDQALLYVIAFQSLRLHALMHDIGHPPFSHVTENALGDIRDYISKKPAIEQTKREVSFLANFTEILKGEKFHEKLGNRLERELLQNLTKKFKNNSSQEESCQCYFLLIIEYFTQKIFESKENPLFECLANIVSSDLDADRLDYVSRDLFSSGLISYPINHGRLYKSYQLFYRKITYENGDIIKPSFLPSVRALSNIEEFYRLRFDLYKYVIFHHRVLKTDGLLRKVIFKLAINYLENPGEEESIQSSLLLPDNISGLWQVMNGPYSLPDDIIHDFIQWDDSWLLSLLRRKFLELEENHSNQPDEECLLRIQLEEIISNKKFYYSLHKRVDTYIPIDVSFLDSIPENFSWKVIKDIYEKIATENNGIEEIIFAPAHEERIKRLSDYFSDYLEAKRKNAQASIDKLRESWGFFTTILFTTLNQLFIFDVNGILINTINEFKNEFNLDDVLYIDKHISPGVKSNLPLIIEGKNGRDLPIGSVSRIADDLNRSSSLFPPFFIFTFKQTDNDNLDIEEMRIRFGKILWAEFEKWIKKNLGEIVNDK